MVAPIGVKNSVFVFVQSDNLLYIPPTDSFFYNIEAMIFR